MENANTSKFFNREIVDRFKKIGGVRIESDVVLYVLNFTVIQVQNFLPDLILHV